MEKVVLLRYGEIHLKGKNRGFFDNQLIKNIESATKKIDEKSKISKVGGRYLISEFDDDNLEAIVSACTKVFGLVSLSIATKVESTPEKIEEVLNKLLEEGEFDLEFSNSFKIDVKRANKKFPIQSTEFERQLGGVVLDKFPNLKVNLTNPEKTIFVDIRENGSTFIFGDKIKCCGGMPVGTSGKGLAMLSGGIDSPVACYMMAKRGMKLSAVHFHSFPYTSQQAKQKVIDLAKEIVPYTGELDLYVVSFTKIQEEIHKKCKDGYMITIMRRIMMRICEKLAEKHGFQAVITGENLAQVASQTIESMTSTENALKNLPVYRPLIAFDKIDIIEIAKQIGTFETSILPYEDCCTVFLPKNPLIKPKIELVEKEESYLDMETLVNDAVDNLEFIHLS
ncbi:MAG: tRNA 4-thiouridine(8) synthase ThiI [Firmicutes bacterium]|nr:tRNA 4-thiouridine(8) synthase ThiI [Bacillota bacterium]MDY3658837.1 tRNA uracil 4-sulfurtransferase ThiI [Eubacteriales bacterium]